MKIHCLGDSITAAGGLPENGRWTIVLQMMLEARDPGKYEVYTNGVGGDTTSMGLERMKEEERDTGITIIEFGFNDASCRPFGNKNRVGIDEFHANLLSMGKLVKARGGTPVYVINHHTNFKDEPAQPDGFYYTQKVKDYGEVARAVAEEMQTLAIDLPAIMAREGVNPDEFYNDGVHLSASGNRIYAKMIYEAIEGLL